MPRLKTFAAGSTIFPGDMNNIEDDYEYAFSTYKVVLRRSGVFPAGTSVTQILSTNGVLANGGTLTAANGDAVFYLDPAWFSANTRVMQYNIRAQCIVGGTSPAVTLFTVGLYPVTFNTAGAGAFNAITLGALQGAVSIGSPSANAQSQVSSGDATMSIGGWYALAVSVAGGPTAASSVQTLYATLTMRQV